MLKLVATGHSNDQIASLLFISPRTASVHTSHILAKLAVGSRTEATALAFRSGLVEADPSSRATSTQWARPSLLATRAGRA